MKVMKKVIKATLAFVIVGSSLYAQTIADAKKAIDAEQYQKAKSALKNMVAAQPANAEAHFFLGQVYLKTDYIDSAKAVFQKGVTADAKSGLNYIGLGAADLESNNVSGAKANFEKAISLASKKDNKPYLYVGKAYTQASKPDYQAALTYLEKAKAINDKDAEVFLALADAHRGMKDLASAYSEYRTAFEMDKSLLRAKVELGVMNKTSRAWQESVDAFNSVIALNANYGPAYRELADTYYWWADAQPKDYEAKIKQALQYYEKYMDLTDRSIESRMKHADFLILTKDYKALEKEAQEMSKLDKTNPRIFRYLGYAAFENGNYPASVQAINGFLAKTQKPIAQDYLYLGKAQMNAGDTTNAIANLKKAVSLDSTYASEFSVIGQTLIKARKFDKAAEAFELSVKSPKSPPTDLYSLGIAHYFDFQTKRAANQNPDKALLVKADTAFSRLLQRAPTTQEAVLYRARIQRLQDDENDAKGLAVPLFQQYVELVTVTKPEKLSVASTKTGLLEAYTYLGSVAARRDKDNAKALEYFNKGLALDPANAVLNEAKKAVAPGK